MRVKPFVLSLVVCLLATFAWCQLGFAQQQAANPPAVNPLVRLLQAKGILTEEEVAQINQGSSPADANQRLAILLLGKGIISQSDYDQAFGAPRVLTASAAFLPALGATSAAKAGPSSRSSLMTWSWAPRRRATLQPCGTGGNLPYSWGSSVT